MKESKKTDSFFIGGDSLRDTEFEKAILQEIEPVIAAMGFEVVELKLGRTHRMNHVSITVYRPEGVGIDDCTAITRNILPRIEMIEGLNDVTLEVSSPGLNRILKSPREYTIFSGKQIRVLWGGNTDWVSGKIAGRSGDDLILEKKGERLTIPISVIRKAKLDESEEDSK